MLDKKDKAWLRKMFREEIKKALTVPMIVKRTRDPKTGVPLTVPEKVQKDIYLPDHWAEFLPFYEQAIVLSEQASEQSRNAAAKAVKFQKKTLKKLDAVGNLYTALERPLMIIAALSDHLQGHQLTEQSRVKLIYDKDAKSDSK